MALVIEGETILRHNDGPLMVHTERTEIGPDGVRSQLIGIGPGCLAVDPVIETHQAVIAYERKKADARERSAYINRPITPLFKTRQDRLAAAKRKREAINVPSTAFEIDPTDG